MTAWRWHLVQWILAKKPKNRSCEKWTLNCWRDVGEYLLWFDFYLDESTICCINQKQRTQKQTWHPYHVNQPGCNKCITKQQNLLTRRTKGTLTFNKKVYLTVRLQLLLFCHTHKIYTYKIKKKKMRQGRPPLKLCYLINNYNTDIGNLTLSTHNLFGTKKIIIK